MRYVTAGEMKEIDRRAQEEYGIPSIILMENAGRQSAEEVLKRFRKGRAAIFCGKGNNGGDGFVCARYLKQKGLIPHVYILGPAKEITGKDPLTNLNILKKIGVDISELSLSEEDIRELGKSFRYDVIVDAVFGIGFRGALPDGASKLVRFLNGVSRPIYALDVPSGFDATTGMPQGECIRAFKTITFGLPKKGFLARGARKFLGRVVVKDIGMPRPLLA